MDSLEDEAIVHYGECGPRAMTVEMHGPAMQSAFGGSGIEMVVKTVFYVPRRLSSMWRAAV
ncbi:MAG: hypothetical protein CFE29_18840 [Bradyrhizobiaceae bacterium PARB1]|nr:MAG: hypothetical protein CFE29_18840 [Bradyrhizobiaceae bacterium PARB1]